MYPSTELPFQHVNFDSPQSIEVSKLTSPAFINENTQETQIYIRLQCPNVQKPNLATPVVKRRSRKICRNRLLACFKPPLDDEGVNQNANSDIYSQWSQLVESKAQLLKCDWCRIPDSQQPSNGQMWMRVSKHRICLMILICGNNNNLDKTAACSRSPAAYSSISSFSLYHQSMDSLKNLFPANYYYWDSGQIKPGFDALRSKISITDNNVYFVLAPTEDDNTLTWTDNDITLLQQTCDNLKFSPPDEEGGEVNSERLFHQDCATPKDPASDTDNEHVSTGDSK